jgi:hypothetical protein
VRPNERAILKHTTTPGIGGLPSERGLSIARPGVETERASYPIPEVAKGPHAPLRPTAACVTDKPCEPQSWLVTRCCLDETQE